jgi:hypothetical protein
MLSKRDAQFARGRPIAPDTSFAVASPSRTNTTTVTWPALPLSLLDSSFCR